MSKDVFHGIEIARLGDRRIMQATEDGIISVTGKTRTSETFERGAIVMIDENDRPLTDILSFDGARALAERCIAKDSAAITHPRTILNLSMAVAALLITPTEPEPEPSEPAEQALSAEG